MSILVFRQRPYNPAKLRRSFSSVAGATATNSRGARTVIFATSFAAAVCYQNKLVLCDEQRSFSSSSASAVPENKNKQQESPQSDQEPSSKYSLLSLASLKKSLPTSAFPSFQSLQNTLTEWGSNLTEFQQSLLTIVEEVSLGKNSLYKQIVDTDRFNLDNNPEMAWDAHVRLDDDGAKPSLCLLEKAYLSQRRAKMKYAFARYIGVDPDEVDERDIPTLGIAASGGGYRAMVNTMGCLKGAKETGLLDVTSYIAGISGSCWALGLYYSLCPGKLDSAIDHLKSRIVKPFMHPATLELLTKPPTNKYLLSGAILKSEGKGGNVSIVDVYGTLVSSRLLVNDNVKKVDPLNLKLSNQRAAIQDGSLPLPIYSVIRHDVSRIEGTDRVKAAADTSAWQWFEITPFETGCEQLGAWIPTWSLGRVFENGKSIERQPELSMTVLYGIFASAFCATLEHYYKEIKPVLQSFSFFDQIDGFASSMKKDMEAIHPFPPAALPNFLKGLHGQVPRKKYDEALYDNEELGFFDAGALCNVPYMPLFRRDVDVVVALDASADSQDVWFERAEEFAAASGMKERWPKVPYKDLVFHGQPVPGAERSLEMAEEQASALPDNKEHTVKEESSSKSSQNSNSIGPWNCWVGFSEHSVQSDVNARLDNPTVDEVAKRDGVALVYCPLLPSKDLQNVSEIWSTWKFDYTQEQTQQLVDLARENFTSGDDKFKTLLHGIWVRKRDQRLKHENEVGYKPLEIPESWRNARPTKINRQ